MALAIDVIVSVVRTRAKKAVWLFWWNSMQTRTSEATSASERETWKKSKSIPRMVIAVDMAKKDEKHVVGAGSSFVHFCTESVEC